MARADLAGGISTQVQNQPNLGGGFGTTQVVVDNTRYYEASWSAMPPGRPDTIDFRFLGGEFATCARIQVAVEVPLEGRGGQPMVEVFIGSQRIASFSDTVRAIFIDTNDPAWSPLEAALQGSSDPDQYWTLDVSGFEAFDTWTEALAYTQDVTITVSAWGEIA